jgi:hypothetical protein
MKHVLAKAWPHLPATLAFALLAVQMAIPWTAPYFVTQDGPSHLYGATVARELVLHHRDSVYSSWYTIQRAILPNVTATFLLAMAESIAGPEHAEQVLASVAILAGFLAFCYASRALSTGSNPRFSPWTPVANFLFQTWFLWLGFYNFYLGMALMAFPIGFYIRHAGGLGLRRAAALAAGLVLLFFTHIIPAAIAIMTVVTVAFWINVVAFWINVAVPIAAAPIATTPRTGRRFLPPWLRLRELGVVLASALPAVILIGLYLESGGPTHYNPQIAWAWNEFPMHVFQTGSGRSGAQTLLSSFFLYYIAAGILLMRKREWTSARGGLAVATLLAFLAYLLTPDAGFGGSLVKIRLSWAVFLLGGLLACSVMRLRPMRVATAIWVACFLAGNAVNTMAIAKRLSNVAADYLPVANLISPRSTFVRLRYPTPHAAELYGYEGIGRDPLAHLAGLAAARRGLVDLSDYEAVSKIFPVVFKRAIDPGWQSGLWGMEGPDSRSVESLAWVNRNLPAPIDFILVIGDENSPEAVRAGMPKMLEYLGSNLRLVATSPNRLFSLWDRPPGRSNAPKAP